jgi:hypothetical protein
MWRKFDLTGVEIDKLCRTAGKPEYAAWLRGYYDNLRRQLMDRFDWMCQQWLKKWHEAHPVQTLDSDDDTSFLPDVRVLTQAPTLIQPTLEDLTSPNQLLISLATMKSICAPIDVVDSTIWTDRSAENSWLMLIASRLYTYAKYRMVKLWKGESITITEFTRMYRYSSSCLISLLIFIS